MPLDTVDSEVYIKTPRGPLRHPDGPMDVLNLEEEVDHPLSLPNRVTKDKLTKFKRERRPTST